MIFKNRVTWCDHSWLMRRVPYSFKEIATPTFYDCSTKVAINQYMFAYLIIKLLPFNFFWINKVEFEHFVRQQNIYFLKIFLATHVLHKQHSPGSQSGNRNSNLRVLIPSQMSGGLSPDDIPYSEVVNWLKSNNF